MNGEEYSWAATGKADKYQWAIVHPARWCHWRKGARCTVPFPRGETCTIENCPMRPEDFADMFPEDYQEQDNRIAALEAELAAVKRERDEAREMVDKFRWLVEVQELRVHRIIHAGEWADKHAGPDVRIAWKRRESSNYELRDTHRSALSECGEGKP